MNRVGVVWYEPVNCKTVEYGAKEGNLDGYAEIPNCMGFGRGGNTCLAASA